LDERNRLLRIGAACVVLTLIFLLAGFPYDALESRVVRAIEQAVGGRMRAGESQQSFGFTGPQYEWQDVRITGVTSRPLDIDRLSTRLAWSTSWFRLAPAYHVDLEGPSGSLQGVVNFGSRPRFDGRLEQFDLAMLPPDWTIAGVDVTGRADASLDVTGGEQWMGEVSLSVTAGSLTGGSFRIGLPFDELSGELQLAGDHRTEIASLHISGPLLTADVTGSIGPAAEAGEAPVDLAVEIDADVRATSLLRNFGIRLNKKGVQSLTISGTVAEPQVR
jgi:type II secretion system protein N